jgi:D-sedoheptulose 7-phosphate isomerase
MNPVSDPPGLAWPTDVSPVKFPVAPYASAASYFDAYADEISRAAKTIEPAALDRAGALLIEAYARGSRAFSSGNGGWASIANRPLDTP